MFFHSSFFVHDYTRISLSLVVEVCNLKKFNKNPDSGNKIKKNSDTVLVFLFGKFWLRILVYYAVFLHEIWSTVNSLYFFIPKLSITVEIF